MKVKSILCIVVLFLTSSLAACSAFSDDGCNECTEHIDKVCWTVSRFQSDHNGLCPNSLYELTYELDKNGEPYLPSSDYIRCSKGEYSYEYTNKPELAQRRRDLFLRIKTTEDQIAYLSNYLNSLDDSPISRELKLELEKKIHNEKYDLECSIDSLRTGCNDSYIIECSGGHLDAGVQYIYPRRVGVLVEDEIVKK